jgi:hypothetical protein
MAQKANPNSEIRHLKVLNDCRSFDLEFSNGRGKTGSLRFVNEPDGRKPLFFKDETIFALDTEQALAGSRRHPQIKATAYQIVTGPDARPRRTKSLEVTYELVPELSGRRIEMACRLTPESSADVQRDFSKGFPAEIPCPPEMFERMKAASQRPRLAAEWDRAVHRLAGHFQTAHDVGSAREARKLANDWLKGSVKAVREALPQMKKTDARAYVAQVYQTSEDISWTMANQGLTALMTRKHPKPGSK